YIQRTNGDHADAFATKRHSLAIHVLPQEIDVPRVGAQQQRFQVKVNDLLGDVRRERGIADTYQAIVGEDLNDEPSMEGKGAHRGLRQRQQVHRIGAKMRWQRNGLAAPLDDARPNLFDLHSPGSRLRFTGLIVGMIKQSARKARTWNDPARPRTRP